MILTQFTNLQDMETFPLSSGLKETAEQMKERFNEQGSHCACYVLSDGKLLCIDFVDGTNEAYLYN